MLVVTLMVPPVAAFLFESDLDFETGCYISYVKEKAIKCFESTLGCCFDKLLGQTKEASKAKASTATLKAGCASADPEAQTEEPRTSQDQPNMHKM